MSNSEGLFKPGSFARVSIETDRVHGATAVLREAVEKDKAGNYVMVASSGKAERRPVTTGVEDTDYVAITEGLAPGEKVVTMSAMPLKDGSANQAGRRQARRQTRRQAKGRR